MSEQREKIEHPSWCDQSRCTAPEVRPVAGDAKNGDPYGQHLSAVISLSGLDAENGLEICMLKAVAPWDTGVFLCFRTSNGDRRWQTEVDSGGYGMALFDLLAAQIAVDAREYPALFGERYGWVADGILGDADEAAAAAGPVELFPAEVWKDAPALDPATRLGLPPDPATRVPDMDAPCDCGADEDPDGETMCNCTAQRTAAAADARQEAAEVAFLGEFGESMDRMEGEWENLPGVTDTYPSTAISDNAEHVEDQEDVVDRDDPRTYQVTIDNSVVQWGPFQTTKMFIARFVTDLLEHDEGLALDAQTINLAFNMGSVQRALDQDGEWSTLFGAGTRHPKHIKVTVTDGS